MTVDVELNTPSLVEIMRRLGNQSNKAYLIIEQIDGCYLIVDHNEKYRELTQFTHEEIHKRPFLSIFIENRYQQIGTEIDSYLKLSEMFDLKVAQVKQQSTFYSKITGLPFGQQNYLIFIEDITINYLNYYIDQLEHKMFLSIEKNQTFYEQISFICSEIDEIFAPYTYTMVTLKIEQELVAMISDRFEVFNNKQFIVTDDGERQFYQKLIADNQVLQIEDINDCPLNRNLKRYVLQHNYRTCWFIPITNKQHVIGVMTMFFDASKPMLVAYKKLRGRLLEIIATCYELHEQQLLIQQLAYTDQATGLPNIHQFKRTLKELSAAGTKGVIKIVKASEFSKIVELYGRQMGDLLLDQLAARLQQAMESEIFHIARFTSSSLIIFTSNDFDTICYNTTSLLHITATPFQINGRATYITLKSGFSAFHDGVSCEDSIRFAEVALEKAKKIAGTQTEYYEGNMEVARQREMQILNCLTKAIRDKEIETYFQPKVMLYRERIVSVEALARWHSKELGFVSPGEFIPVAENAGLIRDIDLLMLEQILQWMQQRLYAGKKIIPVAINISPIHFYHAEFVMNVKYLLDKYYIDPQYLIVEVTETIGLADLKRAKMILRDLHNMGVKTSVDDFGIGYSSLSYLQNFSFQELKIDRSFTWKIHETGTRAIVRAIINIAHTLQMTVIAEGVETLEQVRILKELKCDLVQGYYYYKPISIEQFEQMYDLN